LESNQTLANVKIAIDCSRLKIARQLRANGRSCLKQYFAFGNLNIALKVVIEVLSDDARFFIAES
jgi:hypothetical protein